MLLAYIIKIILTTYLSNVDTITKQRQVVAFIAYFAPVNQKSFCKAGKRQERETPHRKKSKNFIPYQL